MNGVAAANLEEAAAVAAEFLSSLDNLPNEVQHLLAEIRHKEARAQEIQQEIQRDTTRYIRHGVKSSTLKEGKENGKEKDKDSKDALIPARVATAYAELDQIADEKIRLAARLVDALTRVNARLDHDLGKVVALSGEQPQEQYEVRGGYVVGTLPGATGAPITLSANTSASIPATRSVREVQESIRGSLANDLATSTPIPSAVQGSQKRILQWHSPFLKGRRLNTGASMSSINVTGSRGGTPQARSRLAQAVHPSPPPAAPLRNRRAPSSVGDDDADADNDADADGDVDDPEESGDPEDKELYCYCQKMSYGEMIGCDNDNCAHQWFHLGCVGLKAPLPEHWYCDECLKSLGAAGAVRGRGGERRNCAHYIYIGEEQKRRRQKASEEGAGWIRRW
ncbi:hypothetical protein DFH11DRAFT_1686570 [Phellopilus nigrolimitatus]|nr:hypothetical protein DFH11DRAFT_1686570 [Phellopilus nigrolimitatus]